MIRILFIHFFMALTFIGTVNAQSWSQVGSTLSNFYLTSEGNEMAFNNNGILYICGFNATTSNTEVHYLSGGTWNLLNMSGFADLYNVQSYRIAFDKLNNLYVVYQGITGVNTSYVGLQKWNGSSWSNLGSSSQIFYGSQPFISIDSSNVVYVAYRQKDNSGSTWVTHVKKFDGTNWVEVGSSTGIGTSGPASGVVKLEFDNTNSPYVCFLSPEYSGYASVYKFDGSNWNFISNSNTIDYSNYSSFTINKNNNHLFLGTQYDFNSSSTYVKEYDGLNWTQLPVAPIKHDKGVIKFNSNGDLYFAHTGLNSTKPDSTILSVYKSSVWYKTDLLGLSIETNSSGQNVFRFSIDFKQDTAYVCYSTNGTLTGSGGRTKVFKFVGSLIPLPSVTGILNFEKQDLISVYPTILNSNLHISTNTKEPSLYKIIDSKGSVVKNGEFYDNVNIDLSDFPSGIYFVHVVNSEGKLLTKIIKTY